MKTKALMASIIGACLCTSISFAQSMNQPLQERVAMFQAPSGNQEACIALAQIPGGDYSQKDVEKENEYCMVDFYKEGHALCPKTWSTSPGTMVYDLKKSDFTQSSYENSKYCGGKSKGAGVKTAFKFKQTMNASGTSGTLSQSSLLYYHFSRFFDTKVTIPVAVYRDMDKDIHRERVSKKGYSKAKGSMNKAGWKHLNAAERSGSYSPISDILTANGKNIYGVLLRGKGERYGTEFNGTRASGWGKGQNRDFQRTPGFLALRTDAPLQIAIESGIAGAKKDSKMRSDLVDISELQMVYWMREIIELTLLDYIFSQQDRIGNIDYRWYWHYVENGEQKTKREKRDEFEDYSRRKIGKIPVPEELAPFNPVLIQKTQLNDNDAGGRVAYANFTKSTGMLNNLKHYSWKTYTRLMELNADLQNQGPVYQWLENSIDLTPKRIRQIVKNTQLAADIIRAQCTKMRFDLDDPDNYLVNGPREIEPHCGAQ